MKRMKKFVSILLTLMMVLTATLPGFAAGENSENQFTISMPEGDAFENHTYEVYQIFTGDLLKKDDIEESKTEKILSNIKWGKNANVKSEDIGTDVPDDVLQTLKDVTEGTDKEILNKISQYVDLKNPIGVINEENPELSVPAGYYLIKDANLVGDNVDEVYSSNIVQIVGNITIQPKTDVPTSDKKIEGGKGEDSDYDDYNIGDEVSFILTGKVSDRYDDFNTYKFVFHDKMSAGLDFNKDSVEVKIDNKVIDKNKYEVKVKGEENNAPEDDCSFEVVFENLKDEETGIKEVEGGSIIEVHYTATLNENAGIGNKNDENKNEMHLEFSNNPNNEEETGTTPPHEVVVFTFDLNVHKYAKDGDTEKELPGAKFILYREVGNQKQYLKTGNNDKVNTWTDKKEEASELTSDKNGNFTISGLDTGVYFLEEIKAPDGYNLLKKPVKIEIAAEYGKDESGGKQVITKLFVQVDDEALEEGKITDGSVSVGIENKPGSLLPETGGMGTTVLYFLGGVLIVGAGAVLVLKKRGGKR